MDHIAHVGERAISEVGRLAFIWFGMRGLSIHTWNSNIRRMTWGMLCEAVIALYEHMEDPQFGPADLTIHDSDNNELGTGATGSEKAYLADTSFLSLVLQSADIPLPLIISSGAVVPTRSCGVLRTGKRT